LSKTVVLALGGNAISREFEEGSITQQFANTRRSLTSVVELIARGYRVAITHGNGPQVGNSLLRVEETRHLVPPLPLGVIVADLEGGMGYMIEQCLQNKLNERGMWKPIVTILTQVLVDKEDPSIKNPTKFVGPFYKQEQIKDLESKRGWTLREDAGRGYRRVVPSPMPREILSKDIIKNLVTQGIIVIAAGGGGIPIYRENSGWLEGVDGVIDKDLAAAILAHDIEAQELYILTGVDRVAIDFKKPSQRFLDHLTITEAKSFLQQGHFPPGSMGPKIEAAILFLEQGGERVVITSVENAAKVVLCGGGTEITLN
jgi:carbamate kinase